MLPQEKFIQFLVSHGYVEQDLLSHVEARQRQDGGEMLDILLYELMQETGQALLPENQSEASSLREMEGYISTHENPVPPLLRKFLEYSRLQEENSPKKSKFHNAPAIDSPEPFYLPQHPSSLLTADSDEKATKQTNEEIASLPSPRSDSDEKATKQTNEEIASLPSTGSDSVDDSEASKAAEKNKLVMTISGDEWHVHRPVSSEYPLDDELLRYASAFQTIFDPRTPHFLEEELQENKVVVRRGNTSPTTDEGNIDFLKEFQVPSDSQPPSSKPGPSASPGHRSTSAQQSFGAHQTSEVPLSSKHPSLEDIPVASPKKHLGRPQTASYQSINTLSSHSSEAKLQKQANSLRDPQSGSKRKERLSSSLTRWRSEEHTPSPNYEPRDSRYDLIAYSSYEQSANAEEASHSFLQREQNFHTKDTLTGLRKEGQTSRVSTLYSSHSLVSQQAAVSTSTQEHQHLSEYHAPEETEEQSMSWQGLAFVIIAALTLTILMSVGLSYHRYLKMKNKSSQPATSQTQNAK